MQRERRLIWVEDRYRRLGEAGRDRYYGRVKGDSYLVYRKSGERSRRSLVQKVESDRDWFWDSKLNRLVESEPSIDIVDSESLSNRPIEQYEHVLQGYRNSTRLADLTTGPCGHGVTELHQNLRSGATAILLEPASVREWVVSLHGGPESIEGTEIRYGGLYRQLLRQGIGVVILNYRGSTGVEKPKSISWKASIEADFDSLCQSLSLRNGKTKSSISLLGASFGGALALMLMNSREVKRTLLVSPLLDLRHQRKRGGPEFQNWFDSKFLAVDFADISFESMTRDLLKMTIYDSSNSAKSFALIYGACDEVLGQEFFEEFRRRYSGAKNISFIHHEGSHQPVTYRDVTRQLSGAYGFLAQSTLAASESVTPDSKICHLPQLD